MPILTPIQRETLLDAYKEKGSEASIEYVEETLISSDNLKEQVSGILLKIFFEKKLEGAIFEALQYDSELDIHAIRDLFVEHIIALTCSEFSSLDALIYAQPETYEELSVKPGMMRHILNAECRLINEHIDDEDVSSFFAYVTSPIIGYYSLNEIGTEACEPTSLYTRDELEATVLDGFSDISFHPFSGQRIVEIGAGNTADKTSPVLDTLNRIHFPPISEMHIGPGDTNYISLSTVEAGIFDAVLPSIIDADVIVASNVFAAGAIHEGDHGQVPRTTHNANLLAVAANLLKPGGIMISSTDWDDKAPALTDPNFLAFLGLEAKPVHSGYKMAREWSDKGRSGIVILEKIDKSVVTQEQFEQFVDTQQIYGGLKMKPQELWQDINMQDKALASLQQACLTETLSPSSKSVLNNG